MVLLQRDRSTRLYWFRIKIVPVYDFLEEKLETPSLSLRAIGRHPFSSNGAHRIFSRILSGFVLYSQKLGHRNFLKIAHPKTLRLRMRTPASIGVKRHPLDHRSPGLSIGAISLRGRRISFDIRLARRVLKFSPSGGSRIAHTPRATK
jgi:hypothetical protein